MVRVDCPRGVNFASVQADLVSREVLQRVRHVFQRRGSVGSALSRWRVARDRIRHSVGNSVPVGNLLESVAPAVGGACFLVGNGYRAHPFPKTVTQLDSP